MRGSRTVLWRARGEIPHPLGKCASFFSYVRMTGNHVGGLHGGKRQRAAERALRFGDRERRHLLRTTLLVARRRIFAFFRDISARGRAYSEAPAGKGRAPMPSTSAIAGQLQSLRATESASQTTHQRHKSPNLPACDPPIPVLRADRWPIVQRPITEAGAAENSEDVLKWIHGSKGAIGPVARW